MSYLSMEELDCLIELCGEDPPEPIDPLYEEPEMHGFNLNESPRERIRELALKGVRADDIATVVGKTPSTVRGHLVRLGLAKRRPRAVHAQSAQLQPVPGCNQ
jgi:hypothetical protein